MRLQRRDDEITFAERVGGRIYRERRMRHLSRSQVECMSGINSKLLFRIEMGQSTPSAYVVFSLAQALGLPIDELYPRVQIRPFLTVTNQRQEAVA